MTDIEKDAIRKVDTDAEIERLRLADDVDIEKPPFKLPPGSPKEPPVKPEGPTNVEAELADRAREEG